MQRLIHLIRQYYHFILFLILELLSLIAVFRFNSYHQAVLYSSANELTGTFEQKRSEWLSYLSLKEENERLRNQFVSLLSDSFSASKIVFSKDTFVYKNADTAQFFAFIASDVIRNTTHLDANYITLNKGKAHGVRRGMGVICEQGVVGKVISVSKNFSLVMSALHKDFVITPRLWGTDYFGKYSWEGGYYGNARIEFFSKYNEVEKGDLFVTTGYSLLFPANVPIGTVSSLKTNKKSAYYEMEIKLSADLNALRTAYIVVNNYYTELDSLQGGTSQ